MEEHERPYISSFVMHLLPASNEAELLAAQTNVDNFVAVLYRICDRLVREEEAPVCGITDVYARLESTEQEP